MPDHQVQRPEGGPEAEAIEDKVWDDACRVLVADAAANEWLGVFLGVRVRLVYQPENAVLPIPPEHGGSTEATGRIALTDGSPLLLIGQSSLDHLNARLAVPVGMERFPPNIVVAGAGPFAEDDWRGIAIASIRFDSGARAARRRRWIRLPVSAGWGRCERCQRTGVSDRACTSGCTRCITRPAWCALAIVSACTRIIRLWPSGLRGITRHLAPDGAKGNAETASGQGAGRKPLLWSLSPSAPRRLCVLSLVRCRCASGPLVT